MANIPSGRERGGRGREGGREGGRERGGRKRDGEGGGEREREREGGGERGRGGEKGEVTASMCRITCSEVVVYLLQCTRFSNQLR